MKGYGELANSYYEFLTRLIEERESLKTNLRESRDRGKGINLLAAELYAGLLKINLNLIKETQETLILLRQKEMQTEHGERPIKTEKDFDSRVWNAIKLAEEILGAELLES